MPCPCGCAELRYTLLVQKGCRWRDNKGKRDFLPTHHSGELNHRFVPRLRDILATSDLSCYSHRGVINWTLNAASRRTYSSLGKARRILPVSSMLSSLFFGGDSRRFPWSYYPRISRQSRISCRFSPRARTARQAFTPRSGLNESLACQAVTD